MTEPVATKSSIDLSRSMQRHIMAAVLRDPTLLPRVRSAVKPAYFADETISDVIAWTVNQWDTHRELPSKAALLDTFKANPDAVKLLKTAYAEELNDLKITVARLTSFARNRELRIAVAKAAEHLGAETRGEKILDKRGKPVELNIENMFREALMVGADSNDVGESIGDTLEQGIAELLNPTQADAYGTGLKLLDDAGVKLERGEIGLVLGATKGGKSHMLLTIAVGLLMQGLNVAYYNLEMKPERFRKRIYRRLAGSKVDMRDPDPTAFVNKLRSRVPKIVLKHFIVKKYAANQVTMDDIRAHILQLAAEGRKPDAIIIDYVGIMKRPNAHDEERHNLSNLWLSFRGLCQEQNILGWSGAQTNRGGTDKELVTMTDIAEAFGIIPHIDIGLSISRSNEEKADNRGRFFIFASRNEQGDAVIPFQCDFSRSLFTPTSIETSVQEKKQKGKPTSPGVEAYDATHAAAVRDWRKKNNA
jgi:replicative DNA helicase